MTTTALPKPAVKRWRLSKAKLFGTLLVAAGAALTFLATSKHLGVSPAAREAIELGSVVVAPFIALFVNPWKANEGAQEGQEGA